MQPTSLIVNMTIFIFRILENYLIKQDNIEKMDISHFLKKLENAISLMVN